MTYKDFAEYWKDKKESGYYYKIAHSFDTKKTFINMLNELLLNNIDIRKLSYESRIAILRKIFNDPKQQYDIGNEINKSIEIGCNADIEIEGVEQ